jgi:hypothetical protein
MLYEYFRVVSHIPKFGDASKSPVGDTASPAGDATSPSGDAVVSHWRCIIFFRDAHSSHSHPHLLLETPHLPREMWSHLQSAGYVTLLIPLIVIVYMYKFIAELWLPACKLCVISMIVMKRNY